MNYANDTLIGDKSTCITEVSSPAAKRPTLSVVIVAYNPGNYVREMFDSLVAQRSQPDEIIYYDDCSTDMSLAFVEEYRSRLPNLRIIRGNENIGISAARNRANSIATSDFIAVLDSDDQFLPDTVAIYRKVLEADSTLDLICADTLVFRNGSNKQRLMRYPALAKCSSPVTSLMARPLVPFKHSSILYRRSKIERIGGYREDLPLKVDFEMMIRFIRSGGAFAKLNSPASLHRTHTNQMSRNRIKGIRCYFKVIDLHETRFAHAILLKMIRAAAEAAKWALGR